MAVGMEPKRELVEMFRCTKLVRIQMLDGNSPEKLFEERSRTRRAGRKATILRDELWVNIHLSTSPVNEFLLTSMEIKLEQLEMVCGSSPASMLEDRLSSLRNSRLPREKGTLPEKLFPERSRVSRDATSPIQSGISPARELPRSRIEVQEELIVFIESGRFPDK
ncbi:PREDICTED: uncharacterized protein LOC109128525 [Camelina sativa]|uniref:Uncharacterized protein LOC109128525 n=1 Tax=Camelina sativa TaxID=90675 RepID=A0ABM1QVE6_CAMSA|nr:PREDICTED: uncharacterized protein LOC109128525 [Camelina sativa]